MAMIEKIEWVNGKAKTSMVPVKVGDVVGFKCDIEQYGKVVKIEGTRLTLENEYGFDGEYIGGQTVTVEDARDCWVD